MQLKPAHTNSPMQGSVFVVDEMSNVYNVLECSSERRRWRGSKVCNKEESLAWMQEEKERGRNSSKVPKSRFIYHGRRNLLLMIPFTVHYVLWNQASIKVISHSQHVGSEN